MAVMVLSDKIIQEQETLYLILMLLFTQIYRNRGVVFAMINLVEEVDTLVSLIFGILKQ